MVSSMVVSAEATGAAALKRTRTSTAGDHSDPDGPRRPAHPGSGSAEAEASAPTGKGGKGGKGKHKGRGGPPSTMSTKDLTGMVQDMAKLLVTHDNQIRDLESVTFFTWILPAEYGPALSAQEEGLAYHKKVEQERAEGRTPNLGPPHVYISNTFLNKLMEVDLDPGASQEAEAKKTELQVLLQALASADTATANDFIPYFRVNKTYEEKYRLRAQLKHAQHGQLVTWFLRNSQCEEQIGKAPKGRLVRTIHLWQQQK